MAYRRYKTFFLNLNMLSLYKTIRYTREEAKYKNLYDCPLMNWKNSTDERI